MAETLDVAVTAGTANITNPWRVPELRQTMDFTRTPEHYLYGISQGRVDELRALGFEVQIMGIPAESEHALEPDEGSGEMLERSVASGETDTSEPKPQEPTARARSRKRGE